MKRSIFVLLALLPNLCGSAKPCARSHDQAPWLRVMQFFCVLANIAADNGSHGFSAPWVWTTCMLLEWFKLLRKNSM